MKPASVWLTKKQTKNKWALGFLALSLITAITLAGADSQLTRAQLSPQPQSIDTTELQDALAVDGIMVHLQALQAIADEHNNNRAAGTPGHQASVDYVVAALEAAKYDVTLQPFTFDSFVEIGPPMLALIDTSGSYAIEERFKPEEFNALDYSGKGKVTAPIQAIDILDPATSGANTSTSGCETSDFGAFHSGNIALIQRGTCPFGQKVENAISAGATAVVIFNEGQQGRTALFPGTLGQVIAPNVPVLATSYGIGLDLLTRSERGEQFEMQVETHTMAGPIETVNVLAETRGGDPNNVVMIGGHFDSVRSGPGINDNGSGTATMLEIALRMAELETTPAHKIRFAFWSAEEVGLLGSRHYVADLAGNTPESLDKIALYLNFDMIGSPNFIRGVYQLGNDAPVGTAQITELFTRYFDEQGLAWEPITIGGRSDHGPFLAAGVAVGGLFSGAENVLSRAQAQEYGHERGGLATDPCYHQACDTIENINQRALDELGDAAAHVLWRLALDDDVTTRWGQRSVPVQSPPIQHFRRGPY